MIDFNSNTVFKLSPIKASDVLPTIQSFLFLVSR